MRPRLIGLLLLIGFNLLGCVFLPGGSSKVPRAPSEQLQPELQPAYREVAGVIHVHSRYSDGSSSIEEIARIAQAQGLDYLIITDHNTLQGRRKGKEGRHGKVLVLVDEEVSTRGGHLLALRVPEEVKPYQKADQTVEAVSAAGGLGFIAHPFARRSYWQDTSIRGMTGLEVYSAREDMEDENPVMLGTRMLLFGVDFSTPGWLDRPSKSLEWWDWLLAEGKPVVGIGSTNAHGLRWLGFRFGPYATLFKLVRSHLLIRGELTKEAVYEALGEGHLFIAHDVISEAKGFLFSAMANGQVMGIMGDQVRFSPGLQLYAYLPTSGKMTLFRDGRPAAEAEGQESWFDLDGPGVYRLEAVTQGRPWIYSNPIYVIE